MNTLGLIPARGGSKGIPRKNIRSLAGKPLIVWTIEAALRARGLAAVVVSTDDAGIAQVAREAGAQVPFMRPRELAADETPGIDPVFHALEMLPGHDAVLLLQPTSPLRTHEDIDGLLSRVADGTPSAVSLSLSAEHPAWMYRLDADQRIEPLLPNSGAARRQDLPPVYSLNGAMYYARTDWLRAQRGFVGPETIGYPMPPERSIDIDAPIDWHLAETLLAGAREQSVHNPI
ncbi:MAG TPA: acylneuraminate cytidylyltransferase family protein [Croceibacterium sp.]|nr:acylneuraminate cytidylyltransferase family protein [Croceibacterium sp.]